MLRRGTHTTAFSPAPAENFGNVAAGILIASPVFGFFPLRALRFLTENVPQPVIWTFPPRLSSTPLVSMMRATCARGRADFRRPSLVAHSGRRRSPPEIERFVDFSSVDAYPNSSASMIAASGRHIGASTPSLRSKTSPYPSGPGRRNTVTMLRPTSTSQDSGMPCLA